MGVIDWLIYNYGNVEIRRSPTRTRMWVILTPYPFFDRLPVQIIAMEDTFEEACAALVKKLEAALVADPPELDMKEAS